MRVHNIYADADGISHFRDLEIDWVESKDGAKRSKVYPATGIVFRQNPGDYSFDWHPASRRQYIVNLDAGIKITAGDGETRVINTGEVILAEDTTGKGHISQSLADVMRHIILIHCD